MNNNYYFLQNDEDIDLNSFYNIISNNFLIKIISDCNIFSLNKILNKNTLKIIKKYILKYNIKLYKNIEEYNKNIENIEIKSKNEIKNIKNKLYELENIFDENILTQIYEYSLQYHDIYEYFKEIIKNKIFFVLKNEEQRNELLLNIGISVQNIEEINYDDIFFKTLCTQNIFEIEKLLFYEKKMILTDDFLIYMFSNLFNYYENKKIKKINGKQIIFLIILEYIKICEKLEIKISLIQYNFLYEKLNKIKVPKNKIIYSKLLLLIDDLSNFLLDDKNKNINYKYFLENGLIDIEIFDILYNMKKITSDMLRKSLKIEKYYKNITDKQILKYKKEIDISHILKHRNCLYLIEKLSYFFTTFDWEYIFKNYNNLTNKFLINNKDKLLIFLYKNYKEKKIKFI